MNDAILRRVRLLASLLLLTLLSTTARALDPHRLVTQYIIDTYSMDDGLPSTDVHDIVQTADGYLWFATIGGLARFDGVRFRVWSRHDTPELANDYINDLLVDRSGALVMATHSGLVFLRDGRFTRYTVADGMPNDRLNGLAQAPDGSLWMGSSRGIFRFAGGKFTGGYTKKEGLPDDRILRLAYDSDGVLWIFTASGPALLRDGRIEPLSSSGDVVQPPAFWMQQIGAEHWVAHRNGLSRLAAGRAAVVGALRGHSSLRLLRDRDGIVWSGFGNRLARIIGDEVTFLGREQGYDLESPLAMFEDREGSLWIGGINGKLHRLRNGKVTVVGTREGLSSSAVTVVLAEPKTGAWYFGTGTGLDRWQAGKVRVFDERDGLRSHSVEGLLADGDGGLFVGTSEGIDHFDGARFTRLLADGSHGTSVLGRDAHGHLWSNSGNTISEQLPTGEWKVHERQIDGLAMLPDADGSMWVGTHAGVFRYSDGKKERIVREGATLYRDGDGAVWIGTHSDGLLRWKSGRLSAVKEANGLVDDAIASIVEDGLGYAWLGSSSGIQRVKKAELDAVADGRATRLSALVLGRDDGLRDIECTAGQQPSVAKTSDGKLLFPTRNGAVVIDPAHLPTNTRPPPVIVESINADGRELDRRHARLAAGVRQVHLEYTAPSFSAPKRVRFKYRLEGFDRGFVDAGARRFADYTNLPPGRYRFIVIAANEDGVWNEAGAAVDLEQLPFVWQTRWFAALMTVLGLALAFGFYRLRIRGLVMQERRLTALVGERTRELREAQADLVRAEKMASVATLVRGIAHELNNPIGYISGNTPSLRRYAQFLSQLARTLSDGSARTPVELAELTRLSERRDLGFVCRDLDKIVDDIDEGARRAKLIIGDLQHLTSSSRRELGEVDVERAMRQTLGLLSSRLPPRAVVEVVIRDAGVMTAQLGQIEQLLTNLIDNAMRAIAPDGRIQVSAVAEGDAIVLGVRDDGVGMADDVRRRAVEPFFTTRPAGEGSGLGLAIVASIVAGHGGTLDIVSAPGQGTTVTARLPRHADGAT